MVYKTNRKNRKSSRRLKKSIRRTRKRKGGAGPSEIPAPGHAPGPAPGPPKVPPAQIPPNPTKCELFDTQFKSKENQIWKTCITIEKQPRIMIYITPLNVVIKSIETIQIPEFRVRIVDTDATGNKTVKNVNCVIKIEDKYVGCFVFINGHWYAIMRLFGSTLNTEYFARTEKNRVFYKLGGMSVDINTTSGDGTGVITINEKMYDKKYNKTLLGNSKSPTITIKQDFENINKETGAQGHIFASLQEFRQQKLLGNDAKQEAVSTAIETVSSVDSGLVGTVFSFMKDFGI